MGSILIIGATSAIAREAARAFANKNHSLVLLGRNVDKLRETVEDLSRLGVSIEAHAFDALDFTSYVTTLEPLLVRHRDLDGAILCIGDVGDTARAETDMVELRRILDTNFTACVAVLTLLATTFEARRGGFLCTVTSLAGERGRRGKAFYGAAKAGLDTYMQALRHRLGPAGVRVVTIKPGTVKTAMIESKAKSLLGVTPEFVGRSMYRAISRGRAVTTVPTFWRPIMMVLKAIPDPLFSRLKL